MVTTVAQPAPTTRLLRPAGAGRRPVPTGADRCRPPRHRVVRRGDAHLLAWWAVSDTSGAQLTQDTYDRLQTELEDLTTRGRVEIAAAIESARALGDLSENGDYHAAKDSQGKMESRIRQLQRLLKTATVVDASQASDGTVTPGTVVTLRYEGDDEDETTDFFVGSIEERQGDLTVVSPGSPLGQALLGHAAGDAVEYAAPGVPSKSRSSP